MIAWISLIISIVALSIGSGALWIFWAICKAEDEANSHLDGVDRYGSQGE